MKILVIGSGGREHAIVDALSRSQRKPQIFALPGNPGMADLAVIIPGDMMDEALVLETCRAHDIDLVVIGPEAPLAAGLADALRSEGFLVFGPGADGAQLETSKDFAKRFMEKYNIPTASYQTLTSYHQMLEAYRLPIVIKADGLASGKGVFIPQTQAEYEQIAEDLFIRHSLGESADKVVLEELLVGPEISFFYLISGQDYLYVGNARDHKRAYDGSKGPNTGGMGAFTPVELTPQDERDIEDIIQKTVHGLNNEGIDFRGVAFIGCMKTSDGLKVLEYNVRFGDPETQALQALWGDHLLDWLESAAKGEVFEEIELTDIAAVCLVICSQGYPGELTTSQTISLGDLSGVKLYHAGTALENGRLINRGGRAFNVVAVGETIEQARRVVYDKVDNVKFYGRWYRTDIAREALE